MRVNKFLSLPIFIAGVIVVFALVLSRNYFTTSLAHGDTGQNLTVFDDQLSGQFTNWSWGSSVNLSNASPTFSGADSISFTPSAWGGLYLHANTPITTTSYNALQFAMQTSDQEKNFTLLIYDTNNKLVKSIPLSQYPGVEQNSWKVYTLPASAFPSSIGGFAIQETSGSAGPTIYVDNVQFVGNQTASVAPTTTAAQIAQLYGDSLASGWVNWSWNSTINFNVANPVYQGSDAISFTPTSGYGGLYLHSDQGIDTTPYQALTFAAKASTDGGSYAVGVYDANNQLLHSPVSLDAYGGQPVSGNWKVYTIPLKDLNADKKLIKGGMIQDTTGKTGQTLYLDAIALTTDPVAAATSSDPAASSTPVPSIPQTVAQVPVSTTVSGDPLSGEQMFDDPDANPAQQQEAQWQSSNPTNAALMAKIADQPKAIWMGNWDNNIQSDVQTIVDKASASQSIPLLVAYNIPNRDCGSYSAGGSESMQSYESWISAFAQGIGNRHAAVVLEPDALAQITCLSSQDQAQRYQMLQFAVQTLKALGNTAVYLDAGNSTWVVATDMASRLQQAGIDKADGFAINVSNFQTDSSSINYGQQVSSLTGGKHFIVDTSRNGNGPASDNSWCNPDGRALGDKPTTQTGNSLVDAFVWIKYPGESDGSCNGAPAAGVWYPNYALGLAQRARW